MPGKRIRFQPNVPQLLKLADPQGEWDDELRVGRYQTTDGAELVLPRQAVILLNDLDPAAGEEIGILKLKDDWNVWLTASSEMRRADAETALESPETDPTLLHQLDASIKAANTEKRRNGRAVPIRKEPTPAETLQPRLFDRGTGTDGPVPQLAAAIALPAKLRKGVPYQDMLRAIVRTVKSVLESEKLQLGDDPTQKIIVTLYIDAARRSGVIYDFGSGE
jgi:hypothetical protein